MRRDWPRWLHEAGYSESALNIYSCAVRLAISQLDKPYWQITETDLEAARSIIAAHFAQVIATDASAPQIERAFPHERVTYRVEPAEATSLDVGSVDLTTVGAAVHWFDFDAFYAEVRRMREVIDDLQKAWGSPQEVRLVRWPLHLRVGRV